MNRDDLGLYPSRDKMLNDLLENYKIKDIPYSELIKLIGNPEYIDTTNSKVTLQYNILTDFGHDIDPVHTKTLEIELQTDSVVKDFKINEWKK